MFEIEATILHCQTRLELEGDRCFHRPRRKMKIDFHWIRKKWKNCHLFVICGNVGETFPFSAALNQPKQRTVKNEICRIASQVWKRKAASVEQSTCRSKKRVQSRLVSGSCTYWEKPGVQRQSGTEVCKVPKSGKASLAQIEVMLLLI